MAVKTPATFTPDTVMTTVNSGLVPATQTQEIIDDIMANSIFTQAAQFVEMGNKEEVNFNVFLNGIGAYWVGEGQRIETTRPQWAKANMKAHKIGVILPVTNEDLKLKMPDFFNKMKPFIAQAFYNKIDAAAIANIDNPFPQSIEKSVTDAAHVVTGDINLTNYNTAVDMVNDAGYEINGYISKTQNNSLLRSLVSDNNGLKVALYDRNAKTLDGANVLNLHKDITGVPKGTIYMGDWDHAYYGIPIGMEFLISKDATLTTVTGEDGAVVNLFERGMQAMRVTMHFAEMITKDDAFAKIAAVVTP